MEVSGQQSFYPWEGSSLISWRGGWMDCRASLDTEERTEIARPTSEQTLIPQLSSPEISCYTNWVIPAPMPHIGIATGYGLDNQGVGVLVPVGSRIFSSPCCPDQLWDPLSLLSNVYQGDLMPGVKQPGREADHSPAASAKVKKNVIYTSTPPYAFMA
jgi:hypothetical protein